VLQLQPPAIVLTFIYMIIFPGFSLADDEVSKAANVELVESTPANVTTSPGENFVSDMPLFGNAAVKYHHVRRMLELNAQLM
jgi:hypothetical protein